MKTALHYHRRGWGHTSLFGRARVWTKSQPLEADKNHYNEYIVDYLSDRLYWNKTVSEDPESLNFWFDFLDSEGTTDLGQLSVSLIGDRSKVIHEDKASSIIFKEVSNSIFINNDTSEEEK